MRRELKTNNQILELFSSYLFPRKASGRHSFDCKSRIRVTFWRRTEVSLISVVERSRWESATDNSCVTVVGPSGTDARVVSVSSHVVVDRMFVDIVGLLVAVAAVLGFEVPDGHATVFSSSFLFWMNLKKKKNIAGFGEVLRESRIQGRHGLFPRPDR